MPRTPAKPVIARPEYAQLAAGKDHLDNAHTLITMLTQMGEDTAALRQLHQQLSQRLDMVTQTLYPQGRPNTRR